MVKGTAENEFAPFLGFIQLVYAVVIGLSIGYFATLGTSAAEGKLTSFLILKPEQSYDSLHSITKFLATPIAIHFFFLLFFAVDWILGLTRWQTKILRDWKKLSNHFRAVLLAFLTHLLCVVSLGFSILL